MTLRTFVDSNVLASRTLRDWLFMIRMRAPMYQLHATPDVIAETIRAVRRKHPTADGSLIASLDNRLRDDKFVEILDDFDGGVEFYGTDEHDRHVHAAAVACGSDVLLTDNGQHFGDPDLLPYDIYSPDEFLCLANSSASSAVRQVTREQSIYWLGRRDAGRPGKQLADALDDAGCPNFADRVRAHLRVLAGLSEIPVDQAFTDSR